MTNPMTPDELTAIKGTLKNWHRINKSDDPFAAVTLVKIDDQIRNKHLPACLAEIERLQWAVRHVLEYIKKEAFMECASAEHCEIVLRKALEGK